MMDMFMDTWIVDFIYYEIFKKKEKYYISILN